MSPDIDIVKMLPFLVPLFLIEAGLMVWALIDIIKRPAVKGNNKVVWIIIVVIINVIGPIVYLVFGRKEQVIDRDKD